MDPNRAFTSELTVFPDYVDMNEERRRTLVVRYCGTRTLATAALFSTSHRIEAVGLDEAWPTRDANTRVISDPRFELSIGSAADHELAILLTVSAAFYLEANEGPTGDDWYVVVDPFEVATRPPQVSLADRFTEEERRTTPSRLTVVTEFDDTRELPKGSAC